MQQMRYSFRDRIASWLDRGTSMITIHYYCKDCGDYICTIEVPRQHAWQPSVEIDTKTRCDECLYAGSRTEEEI